MIFGIGTDLVDIRRIQRVLDRFGRVFAHRILSPGDWQTVPSFSFPGAGGTPEERTGKQPEEMLKEVPGHHELSPVPAVSQSPVSSPSPRPALFPSRASPAAQISSASTAPTSLPCVPPSVVSPPFVRVLAKRFAAKEACAKALGCGIGPHLGWHDMTVRHQVSGRPHLILSPSATAYLRTQLKEGEGDFRLDLSLSDEYPYIQAFVVISHFTRGSYG